MFGDVPSDPTQRMLELLKREGKSRLLELGGGQGRDTLFFARSGFDVTMLDYSQVAVEMVNAKAQASGMGELVTAMQYDVREPLPYSESTFNACFSHMLYPRPAFLHKPALNSMALPARFR
jgi:cyclopropane fatty-acyl-phospholipid synthase-like methyltransferase